MRRKMKPMALVLLAVMVVSLTVVTAAVLMGWQSPVSKKDITVHDGPEPPDVALFSQPTMVFNSTVEGYAPYYGVNHWYDANAPVGEFQAGERYWYDFDSTPTEEANNRLAQGGATPGGWVWIIEVHKDGVQASDVTAEFRQDLKFADQRTAVVWNDSQPGRLVGMANPAPDHMLVLTSPLYTFAGSWSHTQAHGVITFNSPGEYTVVCYLATMESTGLGYPGAPPHLDGLLAQSPISEAVEV